MGNGLIGLLAMICAFSVPAEAKIGRQLVSGEVVFACRSSTATHRIDYLIMQNDAAIDAGKAPPDSSVIVMLESTIDTDSTTATIVEARLRKDPRDPAYVDFLYDENPKMKAGEVLRINTASPSKSELVTREAAGLSGEAAQQSSPLVCVTSKISIRAAKKKKKPAATTGQVISRDLPEREPARARKLPKNKR